MEFNEDLTLSDPEHQSEYPDEASRFATHDDASQAANRKIPDGNNWRIEPVARDKETFYVIRFWPVGRPPICAERRWAVFVKPQQHPRRTDGDDET
jgi:hypothetical protein